MKNSVSFWGLGAGLLGVNAERIVPLSGTPYNNGPQDMAAIMSYIDSSHEASRKKWWEKATACKTGSAVAQAVHSWRVDYMILRRKETVLKNQLPPKTIKAINVSPFPLELFLYDNYEEKLLYLMEKFRDLLREDGSPEARRIMTELYTQMMCLMSIMRKVLIHPMLACGRECSMAFSPSRRHLLHTQEKPNRCVCCTSLKTLEKNKKEGKSRGRRGAVRHAIDLDDSDLDDDDDDDALLDDDNQSSKKGKIVPLTCDVCNVSDSPVRHFAHEKCLEVLLRDGLHCPSCQQIKHRVHLLRETIEVDGENQSEDITVPHRTYCKGVTASPGIPNGFKASAKVRALRGTDDRFFFFSANRELTHTCCVLKIEHAINWFMQSVPKNEKAIFLSFFKGGLDLLEGILTTDLGVDCARFDGDVNKDVRNNELDRFKTSASCKVLLATVQSGGTGLNIIEANHVCFLDRWFNPMVHQQAQDRCHRIGQTKNVFVAYLDNVRTFDAVMAYINKLKATNASVLLADGTELGAAAAAGLSYQELSGMIGRLIRVARAERGLAAKEHYNAPIPPLDDSVFDHAMAQKDRVTKLTKSEPKSSPAAVALEVDSVARFPSVKDEPKIPEYKAFGTSTNLVDLLESDDDDSLLGDFHPTFKTNGMESEKEGNQVTDAPLDDPETTL